MGHSAIPAGVQREWAPAFAIPAHRWPSARGHREARPVLYYRV